MKAKIKENAITIELDELVDSLTPEDKTIVGRQLVADKHLFRAVLECITSEGGHYFTDDERGDWWFDSKSVLELREKLIPLMPDVARMMVKEALTQRTAAEQKAQSYWDWAWSLWHAFPREHQDRRPSPPGYTPAPSATDADVEAFMARPVTP